jgi:hypothetical protein
MVVNLSDGGQAMYVKALSEISDVCVRADRRLGHGAHVHDRSWR